MAKRKCIELIDVKVDFVSFVPRGANGEPFALFKSADYVPPTKGREGDVVSLAELQGMPEGEPTRKTVELSREDTGVLRRVFGFLWKTREKHEEGEMSEETKKALAALTALVEKIDGKVEAALSRVKKDEEGEGDAPPAEGDKGQEDDKGKDGEGGDTAPAPDAGTGDPPAPDTGDGDKKSAGDDEDRAAIAKVVEMVSGISGKLDNVTGRLDKLEKGRQPETGQEREGEQGAAERNADGSRKRPSFSNVLK